MSNRTMLDSLRQTFRDKFDGANDLTYVMAPGRVNLIGDYTDFNDGFVLPMTVDRGIYVAVRKRKDQRVRVWSSRYDDLIEYDLDLHPKQKAGSWSSYVAGVIEELRTLGLLDAGFEIAIDGDLALGAGLSSSAALEVATALSLQEVFGFELQPAEMAKLCQYVEHSYANVHCGIMDQFASRIGKRNHALLLDCRSLVHKNIPLDLGDNRVIIVHSGVERSLAASAYNCRRSECKHAVNFFSEIDSSVTALRDVTAAMMAEYGDGLPEIIRRRCRHIISENDRVLRSAEALSNGRQVEFGALMMRSHESLRMDFEVSCKELDLLVEIAECTDGVLGARMTGAGFGGCTVNLIHKDAVASFSERLARVYKARTDITPTVLVLRENVEAGRVVATSAVGD